MADFIQTMLSHAEKYYGNRSDIVELEDNVTTLYDMIGNVSKDVYSIKTSLAIDRKNSRRRKWLHPRSYNRPKSYRTGYYN